MSYKIDLQGNNADLQLALDKVRNLPEKQTITDLLPERSNPAGAEHILNGYEGIDESGEIITGTFGGVEIGKVSATYTGQFYYSNPYVLPSEVIGSKLVFMISGNENSSNFLIEDNIVYKFTYKGISKSTVETYDPETGTISTTSANASATKTFTIYFMK